MNIKNKSIVKNSVYKTALTFFNLVVPLLVTPYVYRILSPALIGDVEYATSIFNYFNFFGVLGIYTFGLREVSRLRDSAADVNQVYTNLFCIGAGSNLLVLVVFWLLAYQGFQSTSVLYILFILSGNFIANIFYTEWVNEAFEDFRFIAIKTILVRSFYVVLIFSLIKSKEDVFLYVFLLVLTNFLNYTISFIYSRKYTTFRFTSLSLKTLSVKKYLPSLFFILILNNSSVFYTLLDRIMLGAKVGSSAVAYYSVGQKIMEMIRSLLLVLTFVSLPRLSYYLKSQYGLYIENLSKLFHVILMLAIPMSMGVILLSPAIVYVFAGSQYTAAIIPLCIFGFRILTLMIENVTAQQIMFLHGKEKKLSVFNASFGVINLLLNYFFVRIDFFTPFTAILSTTCVEILLLITEIWYIKKKLCITLKLLDRSSICYLLLALTFIPVVYSLNHIFPNMLVAMCCSVILCSGLYGLGLYVLKDSTFIELLSKLKK